MKDLYSICILDTYNGSNNSSSDRLILMKHISSFAHSVACKQLVNRAIYTAELCLFDSCSEPVVCCSLYVSHCFWIMSCNAVCFHSSSNYVPFPVVGCRLTSMSFFVLFMCRDRPLPTNTVSCHFTMSFIESCRFALCVSSRAQSSKMTD